MGTETCLAVRTQFAGIAIDALGAKETAIRDSLCGAFAVYRRNGQGFGGGRAVDDILRFRASSGHLQVLVFDRRDDPVTPLRSQWTYQAMVCELMTAKRRWSDQRTSILLSKSKCKCMSPLLLRCTTRTLSTTLHTPRTIHIMSIVKLLSRIVTPDADAVNSDMEETLHDYTYGITSDLLTQFDLEHIRGFLVHLAMTFDGRKSG
jgi:hypothetical protein